MVAAFLKLGMPTMMSAGPNRAISSRIAGVSVVSGIDATVPPSAAVVSGWVSRRPDPAGAGPPGRRGRLSGARNRGRAPVRGRLARPVARVGGPEGQAVEALGAPRADPAIDGWLDVDAGTHQR